MAGASTTAEDENRDKRPKHSISVIIGEDCESGTTNDPPDHLSGNRSYGKSAFKEVHKRHNYRYNQMEVTLDNAGFLPKRRASPDSFRPPPVLQRYPLYASFEDGRASHWLQGYRDIRYRHPSVFGGLSGPPAAATIPYGTLSYFPRLPRTNVYLRDPAMLAAQNCCAKCGMQFRMTSDLVYHMRTHHHHKRGDNAERDTQQRVATEKYRCTVCQESFKEKHHLSRHMTSHE